VKADGIKPPTGKRWGVRVSINYYTSDKELAGIALTAQDKIVLGAFLKSLNEDYE